jgi:hypothetical protein
MGILGLGQTLHIVGSGCKGFNSFERLCFEKIAPRWTACTEPPSEVFSQCSATQTHRSHCCYGPNGPSYHLSWWKAWTLSKWCWFCRHAKLQDLWDHGSFYPDFKARFVRLRSMWQGPISLQAVTENAMHEAMRVRPKLQWRDSWKFKITETWTIC